MSEFKLLDELLEVDPRQRGFVRMDNGRPVTLADRYQGISEIELSEWVPEDIRNAFDLARNLWLYGWFYYPLHSVAEFHAYAALEMALRRKRDQEGGQEGRKKTGKSPGLKHLLEEALGKKWVVDHRIGHARRLHERRKEYVESHPPEWRDRLFKPLPPWDESTQDYCRVLADTLPELRNSLAHPEWFSYGLPRLLDFDLVKDLIEQLFQKPDPNAVVGDTQITDTGA